MATITSNASGSWSVGATWVGGVKPADNDAVVIAAGHSVLMDDDTSAFTGLQTVTIQGHATTPAMLYFKDGTSGYLKIRTGYNLIGTSGTLPGRLLANSDGVWGNTGSLAFANKAVIYLGATSRIVGTYLSIELCCYQPTTKYLRMYGARHTVTASAANDTLTKTAHGLANATAVMVMSSGTLPAPLEADTTYYVVSTATDTFKLAHYSSGTAIDLTSAGTGTVEVYTGVATSTNPVNVFEDVTAETGWTTTAGHNAAATVNLATSAYDQQRLTLSTIAASAITLSAAVDSAQGPGSRIYLVSRNVSIQSAAVTNFAIVDYSLAQTNTGVFQCEIRNVSGSGTTFYAYGISNGAGHTVSGVLCGLTYGLTAGSGFAVTGVVVACANGVYNGDSYSVSGEIAGCSSGFSVVSNGNFSGTVLGCSSGINVLVGGVASGVIRNNQYGANNCSGTLISGDILRSDYAFFSGADNELSGSVEGFNFLYNQSTVNLLVTGRVGSGNVMVLAVGLSSGAPRIVFRGAELPASIGTTGRAAANIGSQSRQGAFSEDHGRVLGASYAYLPSGDVIKNTSTVRSGGASSSLEVVPLSNCSVTAPILVCEWTEVAVPASSQTRTVYVRGEGWATWPTASELYIEAEYVSNATTFARTTVASTQVLTDNTTWTALSVSFTPAAAAHVRYRVWLKKYAAACKVYIDNQLN